MYILAFNVPFWFSSKRRLISSLSKDLKLNVAADNLVNAKLNEFKKVGQRFRKSTKQIATLGPSSNTLEMIEKLFLAGADVFRLNFSHGEHSEKDKLVNIIRIIEKKYNHPIAILADLQGPKLRVGTFEKDKVILVDGRKLFISLLTFAAISVFHFYLRFLRIIME